MAEEKGALMKPQLTDWFPPEVKPVHPGVYEVESFGGTCSKWYRLWHNGLWWEGDDKPKAAAEATVFLGTPESISSVRKWRGLAVKP